MNSQTITGNERCFVVRVSNIKAGGLPNCRQEPRRGGKSREEPTRDVLLVTRSFLVIHSSLLFKRICFFDVFHSLEIAFDQYIYVFYGKSNRRNAVSIYRQEIYPIDAL